MIKNTQKPDKVIVKTTGPEVEVHSTFLTVQGEGPFAGERAVFIRLAGCNLQCPGCDTEYTSNREALTPNEIAHSVEHLLTSPEGYPRELVVITGGEPFRQNITELCRELVSRNYKVQIETNGSLPPSPELDRVPEVTIVCSPKTGSINEELMFAADAFKYVIPMADLADDGLPQRALDHTAKPHLARPDWSKPIYVQPRDYGEGSVEKMWNIQARRNTVKTAIKNGFIAQLQVHKLFGVE